jgi:hypothetical protein
MFYSGAIMLIFFLVFFGICTLGTVFTIIGTIVKNDWGINLDPIHCPNCNHVKSSLFRKPKNIRQALWGGGTCDVCGTEYDKWGRALGATAKR